MTFGNVALASASGPAATDASQKRRCIVTMSSTAAKAGRKILGTCKPFAAAATNLSIAIVSRSGLARKPAHDRRFSNLFGGGFRPPQHCKPIGWRPLQGIEDELKPKRYFVTENYEVGDLIIELRDREQEEGMTLIAELYQHGWRNVRHEAAVLAARLNGEKIPSPKGFDNERLADLERRVSKLELGRMRAQASPDEMKRSPKTD
jgi:hypothetical protein